MTKRHQKALINMNENLSRVSFKSRNRLYTLLYHIKILYVVKRLRFFVDVGELHWKKDGMDSTISALRYWYTVHTDKRAHA